jgi:hypothetical protein
MAMPYQQYPLRATARRQGATVAGSPYAILAGGATGTGLDNYNILYADGQMTVGLRELTITATDQGKTYGDIFTFDLTFPSDHFTVSGLVNGDAVSAISLTSDGAAAGATVAGSPYAILAGGATGTGLDNYNILYADGQMTVGLRELTITATDQGKTYGDIFTFDLTFPSDHFTVSGLVNGDAVSAISLTSDGAAAGATVAGSPYAILAGGATGTGLDNYNILYADGQMTVGLRELTITATDQGKTYGDIFTFDLTFPSDHFTVSGLVNGDAVSAISLTSDGAAAGATVAGSPYAILAGGATGTGLDNYNILYADGQMTVGLRELTITATDQGKTYGDIFTFDLTFPSDHFTVSGLVNGDAVSAISLTSDGAAAGATVAGSPYAILAGGATGTGLDNYNILYADGQMTVGLRELTITATDQGKTYGDIFTFDLTFPSDHFTGGRAGKWRCRISNIPYERRRGGWGHRGGITLCDPCGRCNRNRAG